MKKQSLIKGSLVLGLAGMLAKVLGFFFRWPLIMLIGDEGIAYYQLTYPFLGVLLYFHILFYLRFGYMGYDKDYGMDCGKDCDKDYDKDYGMD